MKSLKSKNFFLKTLMHYSKKAKKVVSTQIFLTSDGFCQPFQMKLSNTRNLAAMKYLMNPHPSMKMNYTSQNLKCNPVNTKFHNKRNCKRSIIWFNPPFSRNASTKIGKYSLHLTNEHFSHNHCLRKIFNRNNLKLAIVAPKT